jgi:hypothetical protein
MEVLSIGADLRFGDKIPRWRVRGPILTATGKPSKNEGEFGASLYNALQEKCDGDVEKFINERIWY